MSITRAEISKSALRNNIRYIKSKLPKKTGIIAVVKANAYGHGMLGVAELAVEEGIAMLGVARLEECYYLRDAGFDSDIILIGGWLPHEAKELVNLNIIPVVSTIEQVKAISDALPSGDTYGIHIKIETGMNRMGIQLGSGFDKLLKYIKQDKKLDITGLASHFAESDSKDKRFAIKQHGTFLKAVEQVEQMGYKPKVHIANSAGALECPFSHMDYVRLGLAMYGMQPTGSMDPSLAPAMTLKTNVVQVKNLFKGDTIGYGRVYKVVAPMKIAVIPIGYGDGLLRVFSDKAHVLINGKRGRIIGNICMDHCMVDITGIPETEVGDEVVIFGKQGEDEITAADMAMLIDTINYEITTLVSRRVDKVYVD